VPCDYCFFFCAHNFTLSGYFGVRASWQPRIQIIGWMSLGVDHAYDDRPAGRVGVRESWYIEKTSDHYRCLK
jgi:hypothetical protein